MFSFNCSLLSLNKSLKKVYEITATPPLQTLFKKCYSDLKINFSEVQEVMSPLEAHESLVQSGELREDPYQKKVVEELQRVYLELKGYKPTPQTFFSKLFNRNVEVDSPKGLYLHGAVGGGKTMLMDLFYECCKFPEKRRVHFHAFMLDVHARIHEFKKTVVRDSSSNKPQPVDVIRPIAEDISRQSWLICFDEFQYYTAPIIIYYFYDGSAAQYKNRKDLLTHAITKKISTSKLNTNFQPPLSKGSTDGVSGSVNIKVTVDFESMQQDSKSTVTSILEKYGYSEFCNATLHLL